MNRVLSTPFFPSTFTMIEALLTLVALNESCTPAFEKHHLSQFYSTSFL